MISRWPPLHPLHPKRRSQSEFCPPPGGQSTTGSTGRLSSSCFYCCKIIECYHDENINSLAPGRPGCHFKAAIFNLVLLIGFFRSCNYNAPRWMHGFANDKSILVQEMAWCRQATSHYLSQCWPSSMSPYDVTKPQWVNTTVTNTIRKCPKGLLITLRIIKLILQCLASRVGAGGTASILRLNVCNHNIDTSWPPHVLHCIRW